MIYFTELVPIVLALTNIFKSDFVLVCPEYNTEEFLMEITTKYTNWRLVPSFKEGLKILTCGQQNIKCFVLCDDALSVMHNQSSMSMVNRTDIVPLVPFSQVDLISNLNLRLEETVLSYEERNNITTITEWYGIKDKRLYHNKLFSKEIEQDISERVPYIWERRSDLEGQDLIVSFVVEWRQSYFDNATGRFEGLQVEVVGILADRLNFTMNIDHPPDDVWGSQMENGSWNGLVKQLMEKTVDIALDLSITTSRFKVIDYSVTLYDDILTLIMASKENVRDTVNIWVFIKVFPSFAWFVILCIILVTALIASKIEFNLKSEDNFLFLLCMKLISTTMNLIQLSDGDTDIQEGKKNGSMLFTFRILFLVSSFSFYFMFAAYTSDLTASMTAGKGSQQITNFQDVIDQGYTLIYPSGSIAQSLLSNSLETSAMNTVYRKHSKGLVATDNDFRDLVLSNPKFVAYDITSVHMDLVHVNNFQERRKSHVAFGLQKGSDLVELFNFHIMKLKKSGVLSKLWFKWMESSKPEDYSDRIFIPDAVALGYDNLIFLVVLLLGGLALSGILVLFEAVHVYCKNLKKDRKPALFCRIHGIFR